jgi:DNA-binding transcriptional LysR family regulator
MDTNLIFQFRAVYEAGTITRAAEQLSMTPGALSRAMKRLEEELSTSLFTPSGRNILPTEAAMRFYESSGAILSSIEAAKRSVKWEPRPARDLRIATFEVFSTHFASWMLAGLANEQKPARSVTLLERTPGKIEETIRSGHADFGLTYLPELHPELDHLAIGIMELGVFAASKAKHLDLPYAVPTTELGLNPLQVRSLDGWPVDLPREIRYRFEMLETALDLASRGLCRVVCPGFLVQLENERLNDRFRLVEIPVKARLPKLKVYAIKKKSSPEGEAFKKLCKSVRMALLKSSRTSRVRTP